MTKLNLFVKSIKNVWIRKAEINFDLNFKVP